jgi:hypothetical protein
MSYFMLLKESLFSRGSDKTAADTPDAALPASLEAMNPVTAQDADAGDAYLDAFADGVEWETLLVDLACFNDGPEYSAQARF